jgi:hypothetical protein
MKKFSPYGIARSSNPYRIVFLFLIYESSGQMVHFEVLSQPDHWPVLEK